MIKGNFQQALDVDARSLPRHVSAEFIRGSLIADKNLSDPVLLHVCLNVGSEAYNGEQQHVWFG